MRGMCGFDGWPSALKKKCTDVPEFRNWGTACENLDFPPDHWLEPGLLHHFCDHCDLEVPLPHMTLASLQGPAHCLP